MSGLDLAIFHGNCRTVSKIFQLMDEGLYHCTLDHSQRCIIAAAASASAGWHIPNAYSDKQPKSKDYDTDQGEAWITAARAEMFMSKGESTCLLDVY